MEEFNSCLYQTFQSLHGENIVYPEFIKNLCHAKLMCDIKYIFHLKENEHLKDFWYDQYLKECEGN
jgi:hypothetical protein